MEPLITDTDLVCILMTVMQPCRLLLYISDKCCQLFFPYKITGKPKMVVWENDSPINLCPMDKCYLG